MDSRRLSSVALCWPFLVVASSLGLLLRWHSFAPRAETFGADGLFEGLFQSLGPLGVAPLILAVVIALAHSTRVLLKVLSDDVPVALAALPLIIPGVVVLAVLDQALRALFAPSTHCGPYVWADVVTFELATFQWLRAISLTVAGSGFVWMSVLSALTVRRKELLARVATLIGLAGVGLSLLASARASSHAIALLIGAAAAADGAEPTSLGPWREATDAANSTLLFSMVLFVAGSLHALRSRPFSLRPIAAIGLLAVSLVGLRVASLANDSLVSTHLHYPASIDYGTWDDVEATPEAVLAHFTALKKDPYARFRGPVRLRVDPHDAASLTASIEVLQALGEKEFTVTLRTPFVAPSKVLQPAEMLIASRQPKLWSEPECMFDAERRHGQIEIVSKDRVPQPRSAVPPWDAPRGECVRVPWEGRMPTEVFADANAVFALGYRARLVATP